MTAELVPHWKSLSIYLITFHQYFHVIDLFFPIRAKLLGIIFNFFIMHGAQLRIFLQWIYEARFQNNVDEDFGVNVVLFDYIKNLDNVN